MIMLGLLNFFLKHVNIFVLGDLSVDDGPAFTGTQGAKAGQGDFVLVPRLCISC